MALARVAQPTLLTDRVYETIHDAIMSGELPGGTQLKVRDLADQVGTSVMPVREAIRRLEESGLAEREPHRGAVVKTLTPTELRDTYQVRTLLEVEAARLGGPAMSDAECATMRRLTDELARAVADRDLVTALNLDEAVLLVLYGAGGNPVLVDNITVLWQRCRGYKLRGAQRALDEQDASLWSFQPRLTQAACERDGEACAAITRESMRSALDRLNTTFTTTD